MTIRHLQIFIAVCETMNMTHAARQLHISQSSITQAIHELEDHYGLLLFHRLGRRIFVTAAGQHLLQYAYQITSLIEKAETGMKSLQNQIPIRLGASITIGEVLLVELLQHEHVRLPGQEILSEIHNTKELEQRLMEDKLDLALIEGRLTSPYLTALPFLTDELTAIAAPQNPWSRKEIRQCHDLDHIPVFLRESGSGTRELFARIMDDHAIPYHVCGVYNNSEAIKKAVIANLGTAFLSRRLVQREIEEGLLCELPLPGLSFQRIFQIVYHKDKFLTPSMTHIIRECLTIQNWLPGTHPGEGI
ncbi:MULTISPECIES: LysR family transcriptional regulator [unclassified Megasphaera]|uniref:LysR family transcriptional regulator n=1 Tax=unclassified Megasphaera TaxID=2626256 RepID=UPI0025C3B00D|nr:LysR family transcriptional regulator [Megasphaera sp. UBA4233]